MKGDKVVIVVDTGGAADRTEIVATKAGRTVDVTGPARGVIEVAVMTRTGKPVRTARFMANRVISIVEFPADDSD